MPRKALKDLPLQEITLRKYEEPSTLEGRELVKKFLLSIGLINPGDSRDIIVDILYILLLAKKKKETLTINNFLEELNEKQGASAPNIRRQLRRLAKLKLVERLPNGYRITEFGSLTNIIETYVREFLIKQTLERVEQYAGKLDASY